MLKSTTTVTLSFVGGFMIGSATSLVGQGLGWPFPLCLFLSITLTLIFVVTILPKIVDYIFGD